MPRNAKPILISTILMFLAIFTIFIPPKPLQSYFGNYEVCEQNEATKQKECTPYNLGPFFLIKIFKALNDYGAAITALATISIALFTFQLKRSTDRLWMAGDEQRKDLLRSIVAAEKSANAAELSSEASFWVECPIIIPAEPFFRDSEKRVINVIPTEGFGISFGISNIGKSPARLVEAESGFVIGKSLPTDPVYNFGKINISGWSGRSDVVLHGASFAIDFEHTRYIAIDIANFNPAENCLWFFTKLVYFDVMGFVHEDGFCWKWTELETAHDFCHFLREVNAPESYRQKKYKKDA